MMALTAYVLHIAALWLLTDVWPMAVVEDETMLALPVLLGFIAAATLAATAWVRFFRRGPFEHLLRVATGPAQFVR